MPLHLMIEPTTEDLTGKSKWWGAPDLPQGWDYPCQQDVPLIFVCQIRCSDLADVDPDNLLPHSGMLYFFAAISEYLADFAMEIDTDVHNGLGLWDNEAFRVLYSPTCENLEPYMILWDDDNTPAYLPAEKVTLYPCEGDYGYGFKLLGKPGYNEVNERFPDDISLLQIDESDRWKLRLYDCGMINILISPQDLKERAWDRCKCHFYSF